MQQSYPNDLNEAEWAILDPLIPRARQAGRPEKHPKRTILNAILYLGAQRVLVTNTAQRSAVSGNWSGTIFPIGKSWRVGAAQ